MAADGLVVGLLGAACRLMWGFAHLVRMVGTMNAIAIDGGIQPTGAHDPVNKDTELKARHAAMWATTT